MPGRTLSQLRQGVGYNLGLRVFYGTASASGNTTTNLRDSDTRSLGANGHFTGHYLRATSGTDSGINFYISNWTNTNGDFTVTPAASGAAVFDSITFEVYPIHPSLFTDIINKAVRRLWPFVAREVVDESFRAGSPLWNPGFEDWTSATAATGWTVTTSTLGQVSTALTQRLTGQYSARLTGSAGYLGLSSAQRIDLNHLMGYSITMYAIVASNTASDARLRIVDNDGSTTGASYHTGDSLFQLLSAGPRTMRSTDPARQDAFDLRILKDSGASTSYIDRVWIEGAPNVGRLRVPGTMPRGPYAVHAQIIDDRQHYRTIRPWRPVPFTVTAHEDDSGGTDYREIHFPTSIPSNYTIRMMGRDYPTALSADTDNLEVDVLTGELVEVEAAIMMLESNIATSPAVFHGDVDATLSRLRSSRDRLLRRVREDMPAAAVFGA